MLLAVAAGQAQAEAASVATAPPPFAASQVAPPPIVPAFLNNATSPLYRQQMTQYAQRHYGINSATLDPRVIVLHYTVSDAGSWRGLINWWDKPYATGTNTGGENPQPAAHFIVEQNGTIYQTMPTDLMVRNAYGLNHVGIGIEFVERSSASNVLNRGVQREAGLALVRYLMSTYAIEAGDVVGHGTANQHPLSYDLVGAKNDHTDWNTAETARFRSLLGYVPFAGGGPDAGSVTVVQTGVPNSSVWANVTVVNPRTAGFTTAYPCAEARPWASHNNYVRGDITPNFGVFRTDSQGRVCLYTTGQTHLLWDQFGQAQAVAAQTATRVLDTRLPQSATGGMRLAAGQTVQVNVGRTGVVLGNFTVTEADGPGFTTVWPCDQPRPLASVHGYSRGQTVPAMAVSATDQVGNVCLYSSQAAHLIWDTTGFSDALTTTVPTRMLDTRTSMGMLSPGRVVTLSAAPNQTVLANLTVADATGPGFTVAYPCAAGRPGTSVNNFRVGPPSANSVVVQADADGRICLETSAATHVIWDQLATYDTGTSATRPTRLLDTRIG